MSLDLQVEFLSNVIMNVATELYLQELMDNPDIADDQIKRRYLSSDMKRAIKRNSEILHSELLEMGINIHSFNLEQEIITAMGEVDLGAVKNQINQQKSKYF